MMKVTISNTNKAKQDIKAKQDMVFILAPASNQERYSPCAWLIGCPLGPMGLIGCDECPAKKVHDKMTFEEAIEWWRKQ